MIFLPKWIFVLPLIILSSDAEPQSKKLATFNSSSSVICIYVAAPGDDFSNLFGDLSNQPPVEDGSLPPGSSANNKNAKSNEGSWFVEGEEFECSTTWTMGCLSHGLTVESASSLQYYYYARYKKSTKLFWAGKAFVPHQWLSEGKHALSYEHSKIPGNILGLDVKWDNQTLPFEPNNRRKISGNNYKPDHVALFGPESLISADECKDEKNDTTVAAITTSILLIVFFLAMLMLICFRCFCRSGKLVFRENGDKITGRDIDTQSVAGMDEITPGPPKANVADPQI